MNKPRIAIASTDARDDAPLRQADIAHGKLVARKRAASGAAVSGRRRVRLLLDSAVLEHFKAKAGDRGFQALVNEALKQAIQSESLERVVRRTLREELRRG